MNGRTVASNGYVLVRVGRSHHLADVRGYAYEHRVVAERTIGRRLRRGEIVHHIDGDKQNNDGSNLEVHATAAEHHYEHRSPESKHRLRKPGQGNPTILCACGCRSKLRRFDNSGRPRAFVSGHNPQRAPTRSTILRLLTDGPMHRDMLALRGGRSAHAVATALSKLRAAGRVEPIGAGRWRLSDG